MKKIRSLKSYYEKKEYVDSLYSSKSRKKNYVKESYIANYKIDESLFYTDIRLLDGNDFKNKVDILVGGSPCQSFSSVGSKAGLDDTRGTLFYDFARLVKEIKPKVFIYENVRNLINHDKGNTWKVIKDVFDSLGYHYEWKILDAKDYGIPQTRRRLFVIGNLKEKVFNFPNPINLRFKMQDFLVDNVSDGKLHFKKMIEVINSYPGKVDEKYTLSEKVKKYVLSPGTKTYYQKPETDKEIARTILSTMGNRHRAGVDNYITIPNGLRMLTEREAHRLMGFSDEYKIVVSRAQAYKQAGNSIVVDIFVHIIDEIIKQKLL